MKLNPEQALALAQALIKLPGGYDYTSHVLDQMEKRNATVGDVKRAIRTATSAKRQPNGTWRLLGGKDSDEVDLVPVVKILGPEKMRLVTVM